MQKKRKGLTAALILICIASLSCNIFFTVRGGYVGKILVKVGIKEYEAPVDWTLESWKTSLEAMDCDSDIVFFGDSITRGGQWADAFPEKTVVNLGISGDNLRGMASRTDMIASVKPEKVFLFGGINSMKINSIEEMTSQYQTLIKAVREDSPKAQIYIQSVLPISEEMEKRYADNDKIDAFNMELEKMAGEYGMVYIDIHDLYTANGVLNPELTEDGVHLKQEAYEQWYEAIREYVEQ